jgi:hypothetical protein
MARLRLALKSVALSPVPFGVSTIDLALPSQGGYSKLFPELLTILRRLFDRLFDRA